MESKTARPEMFSALPCREPTVNQGQNQLHFHREKKAREKLRHAERGKGTDRKREIERREGQRNTQTVMSSTTTRRSVISPPLAVTCSTGPVAIAFSALADEATAEGGAERVRSSAEEVKFMVALYDPN